MLKLKLTADEYDSLTPLEQGVYNAGTDDDDGSYIADASGALKYAEEMRKHKDRAVTSRKALKEKFDDAETQIAELTKLAEKDGGSGGNFEELYNQSKKKITDLEQEINDMNEKSVNDKKSSARETAIAKLTTDLCGNSNPLMSRYLKDRIDAVADESGNIHTIVKDETGEQTANTLQDLQKELEKNELFATILKKPASSGGGGAGGGGAGGGEDQMTEHGFVVGKPNHMKMRELNMSDPELFKKLHKEYLLKMAGK